MKPIVFHLPGDDAFADRLVRALQAERAAMELHRFPDGESLVRLDADVTGRTVVLACSLARPDEKTLPLLFAADAARDLGATKVLLAALFAELVDDPVGGLLAVPVADTLKRADAAQRVAATEPRDALWQAQTPQMFRYGLLRDALAACRDVTDEAGAVEALGLRPKLVRGDATNLKVTYPADLALAAMILRGRK